MKKLITFIIALLAIATGAKADNRTEITLVEASSADYATIAVVGASVEPHPTIQITTGAPAYFLTYMGGWWKKTGANTYSQVDEGLFTEGTWFYSCQLRVDGDAGNTHRLSENTVVKINGKTCETHNLTIKDDYSYCYVEWPEVTITGKLDDRTEVSLIEATSTDYMTIPAVGTSVTTKPTVSITTGTQARFNVASGYWAKKQTDGTFLMVTSGEFSEGTWCYFCDIWIDGNAGKSYRLSDNLVVKLNGLACKVNGAVIVDNDYSRVRIQLPVIEVKKQDNRTEITLVEATSTDYVTLPVVGASVEPHPTIQITTGAPAYFLTYMGGWFKKTGENSYSRVDEGLFTEGTWCYYCQLRVDGDAGNTHRLSENTVVKINGKTCETHNLTIEDDYSWCYVVWPEVTVEEPKSGNLGTQGTWRFENGVLTVDYIGAMPISTKTDTNPETAFRLKWIDFLSEIKEVVVTGEDVEIQPYFLYFEGDGDLGQHPDDHIKKVTLSSGVKSIGRQALAIYDLKQLCCYGMTPPELASYNTSNIHCFWKTRVEANRAFLVLLPGASVNYALANTEWMIFANVGGGFLSNLHPEDDPVGIKLIDNGQLTMDKEGASTWFDLSGRKLSGKPVQKGIYVNGGRKVLIK